MDLELDGKVVLITGGSKGIGLACAHAFARSGALVAIASRNAEHLDSAQVQLKQAGFDVSVHVADMCDDEAASRLVSEVESRLGPIAVLVNSAGAAKRYPAATVTPKDWRDAMDAKYFTYVNAIDAVLKGMAARGKGSIVNIIGAGGKVASPIHLPGGAANAALMLVSAGLANAWGGKGIRVNAINPGLTMTGRVQGSFDAEAEMTGEAPDVLLKTIEQRIPLGRIARPEEIADAALFLASERASYITGALITMDGGLHPLVS